MRKGYVDAFLRGFLEVFGVSYIKMREYSRIASIQDYWLSVVDSVHKAYEKFVKRFTNYINKK